MGKLQYCTRYSVTRHVSVGILAHFFAPLFNSYFGTILLSLHPVFQEERSIKASSECHTTNYAITMIRMWSIATITIYLTLLSVDFNYVSAFSRQTSSSQQMGKMMTKRAAQFSETKRTELRSQADDRIIEENSCKASEFSNDDKQNMDEDISLPERNPTSKSTTSRRGMFKQITAAAATAVIGNMVPSAAFAAASSTEGSMLAPAAAVPSMTKDVSWPLGKVAFSLLPLAGTSTRRATVEQCVIPNKIWTHDQIQGVVNVNVPVRQTVIKLSNGGGLWVHNPVAPTPQLMAMMKKLEKEHGPVTHIVLGSVALEHKATFGPFCQQFPKATVWIQPGQWAFPINLPIDLLGVSAQRGPKFRELPIPGRENEVSNSIFKVTAKYGLPEWKDEIDYEVLGPLNFRSVGGFSETAFYHKDTKTLLVTDTVVSVTKDPPPIIQEDPRALLFHARNNSTEIVQDTPEIRQRGWRRMVQFGLVFFPSQISVTPAGQALKDASQVDASMKPLGDGAVPINLYPWSWASNDVDVPNFDAISQNGRFFCPPILTKLILDREPKATLEWVDRVCDKFPNMQRIIPCHLNNAVPATSKDFYDAFDVLRSTPSSVKSQRPLGEDLALLQKASDLLTDFGVVGPSLVCDGEPARVEGRFASPTKL